MNPNVDILIKKYGKKQVEHWLKKVGVIRHGYNGGALDGNNCKRLLDNLDVFASQLSEETAPIIDVLRA